jgi:hypothetical protein
MTSGGFIKRQDDHAGGQRHFAAGFFGGEMIEKRQ